MRPSGEGGGEHQIPVRPCVNSFGEKWSLGEEWCVNRLNVEQGEKMIKQADVDGELLNQDGDAEETEEAREGRARAPPKSPSAEELRVHRLTHYPFRSWCPACIAGRAKNWPHLRSDEFRESDYPTICFDYCFLRDSTGGDSVPVLVGRERGSKFVIAHVVPFKGAGADWVVGQLLRDLRKMGVHGKVILKSDQENAIFGRA